jgi:hypothetical protein
MYTRHPIWCRTICGRGGLAVPVTKPVSIRARPATPRAYAERCGGASLLLSVRLPGFWGFLAPPIAPSNRCRLGAQRFSAVGPLSPAQPRLSATERAPPRGASWTSNRPRLWLRDSDVSYRLLRGHGRRLWREGDSQCIADGLLLEVCVSLTHYDRTVSERLADCRERHIGVD